MFRIIEAFNGTALAIPGKPCALICGFIPCTRWLLSSFVFQQLIDSQNVSCDFALCVAGGSDVARTIIGSCF